MLNQLNKIWGFHLQCISQLQSPALRGSFHSAHRLRRWASPFRQGSPSAADILSAWKKNKIMSKHKTLHFVSHSRSVPFSLKDLRSRLEDKLNFELYIMGVAKE
ncbi:MAG: hypothetical protein N2747_01685 [Chitinophagaceae bacterium]|nr:hypothetical protein [Chitinophagaceae bacterium]